MEIWPLVEVRCTEGPGGAVLRLRQERFLERPPRGKARPRNTAWPIPWVGRIGTRSGGSRLERRLLTRVDERIELREKSPRFVYGNADEGGFFRPLHAPDELRAIGAALPALAAVERMGLLDHQWALVRAGRAPLDGFLDLVAAFGGEADADVLTALRRPLAFIANSLVPDAAPAAASPFAERLISRFALPFAEAGWDPANGEADATRMRRAALLAIVGVVAASKSVIDTAVDRCDRYLADRRSLDANLASSPERS